MVGTPIALANLPPPVECHIWPVPSRSASLLLYSCESDRVLSASPLPASLFCPVVWSKIWCRHAAYRTASHQPTQPSRPASPFCLTAASPTVGYRSASCQPSFLADYFVADLSTGQIHTSQPSAASPPAPQLTTDELVSVSLLPDSCESDGFLSASLFASLFSWPALWSNICHTAYRKPPVSRPFATSHPAKSASVSFLPDSHDPDSPVSISLLPAFLPGRLFCVADLPTAQTPASQPSAASPPAPRLASA